MGCAYPPPGAAPRPHSRREPAGAPHAPVTAPGPAKAMPPYEQRRRTKHPQQLSTEIGAPPVYPPLAFFVCPPISKCLHRCGTRARWPRKRPWRGRASSHNAPAGNVRRPHLDRLERLELAHRARQTEHDLLGRLRLLVEHGLGLQARAGPQRVSEAARTGPAQRGSVCTPGLARGLAGGARTWPPYPDCLRSYRRFPWAYRESLPFLYCVTLCMVCFLHSFPLQKNFLTFGMFTCGGGPGARLMPARPALSRARRHARSA